jgi:hypothetical protein
MDIQTRDAFERMALPNACLMLVEDLGDAELLAVRRTRAMREFCWTCPSALMRALLAELPEGEILTYIDADLAFFSDPQPVFDEMGDKAVLIHEHRYAPRYASYATTSGIFNVGLIAIRNGEEGRACLERWRAQCLDKCELDPENGYCGDQKYLDEWPSLYSGLVVAQHPGICVAPWNVENYRIGTKGGQVTADGAGDGRWRARDFLSLPCAPGGSRTAMGTLGGAAICRIRLPAGSAQPVVWALCPPVARSPGTTVAHARHAPADYFVAAILPQPEAPAPGTAGVRLMAFAFVPSGFARPAAVVKQGGISYEHPPREGSYD